MSPTARVICGMIRLGRRTGYEIKQLVDVSTRFFWAASYGQIYPELRRLEGAGLIRGRDAATNGRARREYELTPAGDEALNAWLRSEEPLALETRDEGLLKLFFSDALEPDERRALLASMRARHEGVVASLRSIEDAARTKGGGPYEVLRFGLAYHGFCAERLAEMESEVA